MADYRFGYRGYNPSYEVHPWEEDRSYTYDHMARPVGMDPDGRGGYSTAWNPGPKPNSYVVKRETYVVHRPAFGGYSYPSQAVNYEVIDDSQWHGSSPVYGRPPEVDEFLTKVQIEASRLPMGVRVPAPAARNWQARNRFQPELEEPYTRYQNEDNRPARFGAPPPVAGKWPENPISASYGRYPVPMGNRPSWPGRVERSTTEPPPLFGSKTGWARPNRVTPNGRPDQDSSLSKPINDIDSAMEYLKEAIKPFSSHTSRPNSEHPAHPIPGPKTMPKKDAGTELSTPKSDHAATGDPGTDDAKPQSNSKPSPNPELEPEPEPEMKPNTTGPAYRGAINSREAAKRFNGILL